MLQRTNWNGLTYDKVLLVFFIYLGSALLDFTIAHTCICVDNLLWESGFSEGKSRQGLA